jgi:putative transposase
MRTYLRNRTPGGMYFFTVNLAQRHGNALLTGNIESLRVAFRNVLKDHPVEVEAMVVLPDHLHCPWRMPQGDHAYGMRWRLIKSRFSMAIAENERRSASRMRKGERGVWQRRYWEHLIRDDDDFGRHLDYIHYNPVKHGHAAKAADWPHSTFMRWVKRGVYSEDWAGS